MKEHYNNQSGLGLSHGDEDGIFLEKLLIAFTMEVDVQRRQSFEYTQLKHLLSTRKTKLQNKAILNYYHWRISDFDRIMVAGNFLITIIFVYLGTLHCF